MSNLTQKSQPPQAVLDQIIGLYNQGQLEQTASLAESLAKQYPNALILYDILGAAYMGLKNTEKTIASYQKALELNPNHTDAYNNMGMALFDQGRFTEAVDSYKKAVNLEPDFADAHYNLGNALKQTGDLRQAIESYKVSSIINPNDAEVLLNYGDALKSYGDFDQAIECYLKALKIEPNFTNAQTNMKAAGEEKAEISKLVSDYAKIAKLEPNSVQLFKFTRALLEKRGYLRSCVNCYKQVNNIKLHDAEAYLNLGGFLQAYGDTESAIVSYQQAIRIKPKYAKAYNEMGVAFLNKGDLAPAIENFITAIEIMPEDGQAYHNLVFSLRGIKILEPIEGLPEIIVKILTKNTFARPNEIIHATISLIKLDNKFKLVLKKFYAGVLDHSLEQAFSELSKIPLLLKIMEQCPLYDLELEFLIRYLRSAILSNLSWLASSKETLVFQSALALQCEMNEYIYSQTADDTEILNKLEYSVGQNLLAGDQPAPLILACLASYKALHKYSWCHLLSIPNELRELEKRQISNFHLEIQLRSEMQEFEGITDNVSSKVRAQYEESPYPRWQNIRVPLATESVAEIAMNIPLKSKDIEIYNFNAPKILIAGCGTGLQSIFTALRFKDCDVLAIDLSLSSLAYAQRKTEELNIKNIKYMQADILDLDKIGKKFDIVECCGVLHHMHDPMAGWKVLKECLNLGGFMRISLYHERPRRDVVKIREEIRKNRIGNEISDMKFFRDYIINSEEEHHKRIALSPDFYSTSTFRDLLFHVQEHRFTLTQIKSCLNILGLEFFGFENDQILKKFGLSYPDPDDLYNLDKWDIYESDNPETFAGTEIFWCRKAI